MNEISDARTEALARMAQSRAELRRLLEPAPEEAAGQGAQGAGAARQFPRSRTMRFLMSSRGVGTVGAVVGGLLMARPALALRVLRILPAGAIGRMLVHKAISALRSKPK